MNQPLPPVDQAKAFFFFVLLIVLIGAGGAGILLILVTSWGLYRMRSTHEFSYLDTVFIIHKGFAAIASIGLSTIIAYAVFEYWHRHFDDWFAEYVVYLILSLLIYPVYCYLLNTLFYAPLSKHKEWVVANGIFATTEAKEKEPRTTPLISLPTFSIKTSSNLSVADEVVKLNKLKEDGLVTQDEFDKLRKALLS
jgi:hypothetical protein